MKIKELEKKINIMEMNQIFMSGEYKNRSEIDARIMKRLEDRHTEVVGMCHDVLQMNKKMMGSLEKTTQKMIDFMSPSQKEQLAEMMFEAKRAAIKLVKDTK